VSLASFTGALQGIGDSGNQVATANLAAQQKRIQDLFDQLGLKQGQATLEETVARTKKLGQPAPTETDKYKQTLDAFKNVFGREPNEEEKKVLFGLPAQKQTPTASDEVSQIEKVLGRKLTEEEIKAYFKLSPGKGAGQPKLIQKQEYDPTGHLRYASVDPTTQEIVAWGGPVPKHLAFDKFTDDNGDIHVVPKDPIAKVVPGEVRMSKQAEDQWAKIAGPDKQPFQNKIEKPKDGAKSGTPSSGVSGDRIIGHTTPKDAIGFKKSVTDAKNGYTTWIGAMKNAADKTSKGDLSIIFAAVRSQVQGAGRMTNAEIKQEIERGSLGDRWKRAYDYTVKGVLPDDQREELLGVIRNSWAASASTARQDWDQFYKGKPLPDYLKDDSSLKDLGPSN